MVLCCSIWDDPTIFLLKRSTWANSSILMGWMRNSKKLLNTRRGRPPREVWISSCWRRGGKAGDCSSGLCLIWGSSLGNCCLWCRGSSCQLWAHCLHRWPWPTKILVLPQVTETGCLRLKVSQRSWVSLPLDKAHLWFFVVVVARHAAMTFFVNMQKCICLPPLPSLFLFIIWATGLVSYFLLWAFLPYQGIRM